MNVDVCSTYLVCSMITWSTPAQTDWPSTPLWSRRARRPSRRWVDRERESPCPMQVCCASRTCSRPTPASTPARPERTISSLPGRLTWPSPVPLIPTSSLSAGVFSIEFSHVVGCATFLSVFVLVVKLPAVFLFSLTSIERNILFQ